MADGDKKNNNDMAEAKRIELYPKHSTVKKSVGQDKVIEGIFKDLKEIDDMLNEHSDD